MFRIVIFLVSLGAWALRQQVTALKKERPRPLLDDIDRAFWVALRSSWSAWASGLVIVNADTVARWNRDRFRRYWTRISSRRYPGRPRIDTEIRGLIRTMGCLRRSLFIGRPEVHEIVRETAGFSASYN